MALERPADLLSYQDYAALDDGQRWQVVDGVAIMTPAPSTLHQLIVGRLHVAVANHLARHPAGTVLLSPIDLVLRGERPAQIVQPDLAFVSAARRDIITPANLQGAPDWTIEVLSPGTAKLDVTRKRDLYEAYGVAEYWVVFPDLERIEVYRSGPAARYAPPALLDGGAVAATPLLPGLAIPLPALFAPL